MEINDRMEFDHVIRVHADGSVTDESNVYAPEVHMHEDLSLDVGDGWELLNGYSGQDRYAGPVMHSSEFIGGGMERDILAAPGVYVAVVVMADSEDSESDDDIAGWAVARQV